MDTHPRSWLERLLGAAIILAISAWLLRWAWEAVRPLVPVIIGAVAVAAIVTAIQYFRRNRYW
jgi:CHASE2 domain-containing sensor protein